jgi:hypothetical protein
MGFLGYGKCTCYQCKLFKLSSSKALKCIKLKPNLLHFYSTLVNKYAGYSHFLPYFKQIPCSLPLLRLRPNPPKQINQGQITIQESNQFGGQPSCDDIVL